MSNAPSMAAVFADQVRARADRLAFRAPTEDGGWRSLTWADTDRIAREYAAGLISLGVGLEDRVAIMSTTRLEWVLTDLAVTLAGAATTAVYPNTKADDVAYIVADSGSSVVIVEDAVQAGKIREVHQSLPEVRTVVVIDPSDLDGAAPDGSWDDGWMITLEELARRGREHLAGHPAAVDERINALSSGSLATLIYTSGTTGRPKGVELTHGNWIYLAQAAESSQVVRPEHLQFLWLPLSHVFGKLLLAAQYQVGFSSVVDGRIDKIVDNLAEIKPSLMAAPPRIYEKVSARVASTAAAEGGAKAKIYSWAMGVGTKAVRLTQAGKPVPPALAAQRALADRLVFSKVRQRLGGNIEVLVSGSAPLAPAVSEWFAAVGLPILEGYGMTETTGGSMINRPGRLKIGSVGMPFEGTELRVAEDGELLIRSPGVMRGYHNLPDVTAEVLSADGWLSTGDIAEVDADGVVRITDRKKDLAKTSGGKFVAPSAIEGSLKAADPLIDQAVVVADGRHFPGALIGLDPEAAAAYAQEKGVDVADLGSDPELRARLQAAIDKVNADLNRWEQVKQFRVLPRTLDVESGELTPSLKVKRAVVVNRFADLVDDMYR